MYTEDLKDIWPEQIMRDGPQKGKTHLGPLAWVSEDTRKKIIDLPNGKFVAHVNQLWRDIERIAFARDLVRFLHRSGGKLSGCEEYMGCSESTVRRRINKHGLLSLVVDLRAKIKGVASCKKTT